MWSIWQHISETICYVITMAPCLPFSGSSGITSGIVLPKERSFRQMGDISMQKGRKGCRIGLLRSTDTSRGL